MKDFITFILVVTALAWASGAFAFKASASGAFRKFFSSPPRAMGFANTYDEAVETHPTCITRKTDDTISARHLLVTQGSDANHVALCGVSSQPLGTVDNKDLVAEDRVTVLLLGKGDTKKVVASGAITVGTRVYAAASGKVASTGSVLIGTALTAAASDNDVIEITEGVVGPPLTTGSTTKAGGTLAVPITHRVVVMTTGGAEALTLADGVPGQRLNLILGTDGGDGTLTPTTKTGFATIVFADAKDIVELEFVNSTVGWIIVGSAGVAAPPVIS